MTFAEDNARDEAEWRAPANWHAGFYHSRRDSRAFVPKRSGAGVTINFAHKSGIFFLLGIIGFCALMFFLTRGQRT